MSATVNHGHNGNGRLPDGTFGRNNKFALGNQYGKRVARIRAEIMKEADPLKIRRAVRKQMDLAVDGDRAALEFILSYAGCKPASDFLTEMRLLKLESEQQMR